MCPMPCWRAKLPTSLVLLCVIAALSGCVTHPPLEPDNLACRSDAEIAPGKVDKRWAAIQAGLEEHARFNGHVIDEQGYLRHFGMAESETTDNPGARVRATDIAWMNVKRYWDTLDRQLALRGQLFGDASIKEALPSLSQVRSFQTHGDAAMLNRRNDTPRQLAQALEQARDLTSGQRLALTQSLYRAAINDVPWSASFISYLMFRAGYTLHEFEYSASHINYMRKAFAVSQAENRGTVNSAFPQAGYRYRACDPLKTKPRPGDLLCALRGETNRHDSFSQLSALMAEDKENNRFYPAHCELVTAVDPTAQKLTMVGGNVLQSVVLRSLKLAPSGALAACYGQRSTHYCNAALDARRWVLLMQHVEQD